MWQIQSFVVLCFPLVRALARRQESPSLPSAKAHAIAGFLYCILPTLNMAAGLTPECGGSSCLLLCRAPLQRPDASPGRGEVRGSCAKPRPQASISGRRRAGAGWVSLSPPRRPTRQRLPPSPASPLWVVGPCCKWVTCGHSSKPRKAALLSSRAWGTKWLTDCLTD